MHVRFSTCIDVPVVEGETDEIVGTLSSVLIHPDTGKIEGFYVTVPGFFTADPLFVAVADIVRWGANVHIRSSDSLSVPDDHVRLQSLLTDPRLILGQRMRTEQGEELGRCRDVQFDTRHFMLEWLFPRRMLRWGLPVPIAAVIEVRKDAVIVRGSSSKERSSEKVPPATVFVAPLRECG